MSCALVTGVQTCALPIYLVTYPSNDTKPTAVSFRKVAGVYLRGAGRTNPEEAREVVAEAVRRLKDPVLSKLSVGVVTLNSEQQRLVERSEEHTSDLQN